MANAWKIIKNAAFDALYPLHRKLSQASERRARQRKKFPIAIEQMLVGFWKANIDKSGSVVKNYRICHLFLHQKLALGDSKGFHQPTMLLASLT
ncbi:unnamed protein product [Dovyalis caffra]|uniref:Uncharacterized protein n=1 Tax=Dovyalis caffra TaxID=77055 RepID=A0AAV1RTY9_9ROSI|nr:unnamed protein product [Dovyalis caffra]